MTLNPPSGCTSAGVESRGARTDGIRPRATPETVTIDQVLAAEGLRSPGYAGMGVAIGGLLTLQVSLGISNVLFSLPLPVAVAHNAGAALLLSSLVLLNYRVRRR